MKKYEVARKKDMKKRLRHGTSTMRASACHPGAKLQQNVIGPSAYYLTSSLVARAPSCHALARRAFTEALQNVVVKPQFAPDLL